MDRNEFLAVLENTLRGEIPDYEIKGHIEYYDSYIRGNDGKTEEEKLNELGDPRLIAKTIIDARTLKEGGNAYEESYQEEQPGQSQVHYKTYSWESFTWYQKLLALLLLALVLVVVIAVAGLGLHIFFSIVLPVLVVVLVIRMILSLFR